MFRFAEPWYLLLCLALPLLWWWQGRQSSVALPMSDLRLLRRQGRAVPRYVALLPKAWRYAALFLVVLALARPQEGHQRLKRQSEGLDIVLTIDTSESMHAMDFELDGEREDRLTVLKRVLTPFIKARPDDRLGIVIFGSEAFTQVPLTLDHAMLMDFLASTRIGMAGPNTAIGDALAVSMKRLKDIAAPSKIIILVTDGSNNAGSIDPQRAVEAAKALGIKIYTIGVGSNGQAPYLVDDFFGKRYNWARVEMDEEALRKIAAVTGGRYFQATDTGTLNEIYATIDTLEKTKKDQASLIDYGELYPYALSLALGFLGLEALWLASRWRRLPS